MALKLDIILYGLNAFYRWAVNLLSQHIEKKDTAVNLNSVKALFIWYLMQLLLLILSQINQ